MKSRYVDDQETFLQGVELAGDASLRELDGVVCLGMRCDALRLARQLLRRRNLGAVVFAAAFDAMMIQGERSERRRRLIEEAYARLSTVDQRACRSRMLSLYWGAGDYEAAARFLPSRLDRAADAMDASCAFQTLVEVGRQKEAGRWVPRFLRWARQAPTPLARAHLLAALAVYYDKTGDCERAAHFWKQSLAEDDSYAEQALSGLAEMRLRQAREATRDGLATLRRLKGQHDPDLETTLPGNQTRRWEELETKLTRFGRVLERAPPS
jgi:tetratricopeptide (TPR) repeat protein